MSELEMWLVGLGISLLSALCALVCAEIVYVAASIFHAKRRTAKERTRGEK
jgi:hypothetical protein